MFVIIGIVLVLVAVLGGFALEGGPFLVLIQYSEFLIIVGASVGALLISTPGKLLGKIIKKLVGVFKGAKVSQTLYLDLLKLMHELFQVAQKDGVIGLEQHVENPDKSKIFSKYPALLADRHLLHFLTDTMRLVVVGGAEPFDLESLMDADIETHHQEGSKPGMIMQKIGDSMPGLGIVAAVLGIVITMQAINGPPQEIGHKVAAALVGTFLGILLSYGFVQPLATNLDISAEEETRMFETVKAGVVAFAKGMQPLIAVEFARRTIFQDYLVLIQYSEFLIIVGASVGALLISTPGKLLGKIIKKLVGVFKGAKVSQTLYLDLLKLMHELFQVAQKDGVIGLEQHVENPDKSKIFSKYPALLADRHLLHFLTDTMRLVVVGGAEPFDLESLMDADIETHHQEGSKPGMIMQKIGDSMPGLGIVAAVLGIVITMQAINGPPQEIGHKVAAALVGTFLGILLSYGFVQPLATNLDISAEEETRMFETVKAGVVAFAKGMQPLIAVEFARRTIFQDYRPSFKEMETALKGKP
ncbi:MAG: flagellar motor stator protein MotA [Bacteroidetes bacterium]|nr:flagellar motor stator protein MotA [Bacteroidota bacterium]